jgi:Uma2 family endonuclease
MSTTSKPITGEELLAMGDIGRCELIYGKIINLNLSGFEHGHLAASIASLLCAWNDQHKLGIVLGAETGFRLARNPDLVRAPDVAFVLANRVPATLPSGFFEGAPDLAVEVVSPTDSWPDVESKVQMWLVHGCQSCWIVDPRNRQITIDHGDGRLSKLKVSQDIEDPLLPAFRVPVSGVFAR